MSSRRSQSSEGIDVGVGQRLRSRRLELGLTQMELADALGVTFQQIQKYEKGTNRISPSKLMMAANFLRVAPHNFFETPSPNGVEVSEQSMREINAFLSNKLALALAAAFVKINDAATRRTVADLVAEIAESSGGKRNL